MNTKPLTAPAAIGGILGLVLLAAAAPPAMAINFTISGDPTVTGSGDALKARYHNVATVDGKDLDLFGEIITQNTSKTNDFRTVGDDFQFTLMDGEDGENRMAKVRWTFYEGGTTTPVDVDHLALTIDDFDHYWSRTESIESKDVINYTVNEPTNLTVSFVGEEFSATGGANQETGDSEGAVKLFIESGSSFVITYRADFHTDSDAGFVHDADGDFVFSNPERRLRFTYHISNNEDQPIPMAFSDALPAGLTWDPEHAVTLSGALTGNRIQFSGGNSIATITQFTVHPGAGTVILTTAGTTISGVVYNELTLVPEVPGAEPITASATIVLP